MTSLRTRIALLLILAIVSVVGLATYAASRALRPPLPEATMQPLARQIAMLATLARDDRTAAEAAGMAIRQMPASGLYETRMSSVLSRFLDETGTPLTVSVTRATDTPVLTASVDLGNGQWLVSDIPDMRPPPGGMQAMIFWIALISLGSIAVALYAASRIIRPLELLQEAVGSVGPDGVLPPVTEAGSGEVRATARALNQLSSRLKSSMESRMRLVAAAGHDLRTPMTRMRLRAEFIADDEEREKWLSDLAELDAIADSAIRLVREEASPGERQLIHLDALLGEVAGELQEIGYSVKCDALTPATVRAGRVALTRALRNLLVNAATHGGGATVSMIKESDKAVVTILDHGPGIPDDLLGRVFEPFFRVDPARRKTLPGAGLGLAIAREVVERYGGSLTVANRVPTGLVQTVRIAIDEPPHSQFGSEYGRLP